MNCKLTWMRTGVVLVTAYHVLSAAALPLPESPAPFRRTPLARQDVTLNSFDYRRWAFNPAARSYRWNEFSAGDKTALVTGCRYAGFPGDLTNQGKELGFGAILLNADKRLVSEPSRLPVGEIRFVVKGTNWMPGVCLPDDKVESDAVGRRVRMSRVLVANGKTNMLSYCAAVSAQRKGVVDVAYDFGDVPCRVDVVAADGFAAPVKEGDALVFAPHDQEKSIAVSLRPEGKCKGRISIDFGMSRTYAVPLLPKTENVDFWGDDARHVPVRPTANRMTNGSFEQGLKGWRVIWGVPMADAVALKGEELSVVVADGITGPSALSLRTANGRSDEICSMPLPLPPWKRHVLSFWAKGMGEGAVLKVRPESVGRKGCILIDGGQNKTKSFSIGCEWQRLSFDFVPSAEGVQIRLYSEGAEVRVDGIMLERTDGAVGEYVDDPVWGRLETAASDNCLKPGEPTCASLALTGAAGLSGTVRVRVTGFYGEEFFRRDIPFALDSKGFGSVSLPWDASLPGEGVFVVRLDYSAAGRTWTDYDRFSVLKPAGTGHPSSRFFQQHTWFTQVGSASGRAARRMNDLGYGSTSWSSNREYGRKGEAVSLYKVAGMVNILHAVDMEIRHAHPDEYWWGKPGFDRLCEDVTPEKIAFVEEEAYRAGMNCREEDVWWTFCNEEELWNKLIKKRDFKTWYAFQDAARRGIQRAGKERGIDFKFSPTHGVANYNPHSAGREVLDGYLQQALEHKAPWDFVGVHMYQALDGSTLGEGDRDLCTQYLIERLALQGHSDIPFAFGEGFNMLPLYIPEWGAFKWGDQYRNLSPSFSDGMREFVQAAALARQYLMDFEYYPRLLCSHSWLGIGFMDLRLTPFFHTMVPNVLGRILPDPQFVGKARPYPDVRAYCYLPKKGAKQSVVAVWTSNNDVELGFRKGDVLTVELPEDIRFCDLMGNVRRPVVERLGGGRVLVRIPLTPAPLFVVGAAKDSRTVLDAFARAKGGTSAPLVPPDVLTVAGRGISSASPVDVQWANWQSLPLRAARSGSGLAKGGYKILWGGGLWLRLNLQNVSEPEIRLSFDGFGDAREKTVKGLGEDDFSYLFTAKGCRRLKAVNTQFAEGTEKSATDREVADALKPIVVRKDGICEWTVRLPPRYIAPIRLQKRRNCGFLITVRDAATERTELTSAPTGEDVSERPDLWPNLRFE